MKFQIRMIFLLLAPLAWLHPVRADNPPAWPPPPPTSNSTPVELLFHITRYGNTEAKRKDKETASAILLANPAAALKVAMDHIHLENIGVQILAQDLMDTMDRKQALPVLYAALQSPHTNTQRIAVYYLGFCPRESSYLDAIRPLLDIEKTRGAAIRTLGKWQDTNSLDRIAGFLSSTNERIRVTACNALRDIGDPKALRPLLKAFEDPYFTVRQTAARAVVSFGEPAVMPIIRRVLKANDPARRLMIQSLGELEARQAVPMLKDWAASGDPLLREEATAALAKIPKSWLKRIF